MNQLIVVRGMKRTGNHAVISWLRGQRRYVFYNDVFEVGPVFRGERSLPPCQPFSAWLQRRMHISRLPFSSVVEKLVLYRRSMIVSLEDHGPDYQPFHDIKYDLTNVLIVRDPKNLFASRIRKAFSKDRVPYPREMNHVMQRAVDVWKACAREYLGITSYLPNKVCVCFDRWFLDKSYRQELSRQLGLAFTDRGLSKVSRRGGGSSFDETKFDGNSQDMDVLHRYSQLDDRETRLLNAVMADQELHQLYRQIEGDLAASQQSTVTPLRRSA
jgi:hypothetical protein